MSKIAYYPVSGNKEEWLQARLGHINSTDAYNIVSEGGSKVRAFLDILGISDEVYENEAMYWGKELEHVVAKEFEKRLRADYPGVDIDVRYADSLYRHDTYEFAQCTPDYWVYINEEPYLLECKTANAHTADAWEDGVPDRANIQVLHQMAVFNEDECRGAFAACLTFTPGFIYHKIERDQRVLDGLLLQEQDFYENHILTKAAPAPNEDDGPYLNKLYREGSGEIIELPQIAYGHIAIYQNAAVEEKAAKAEKQAAYNRLKQLVGEAAAGVIGNYEVRWTHGRKRLTIKETEAPIE